MPPLSLPGVWFRCAAFAALVCTWGAAAQAESAGSTIAACVLRSRGEFTSRDKPHGVEQSTRTSSILLVNVETGQAQPLKLGLARAEHPQFSPDGQWLYFQSNDGGAWHIYRCRLDGSQVQNLTAGHRLGRDSYGFDVSPRGDLLAMAVHDGHQARTAFMRPDGTQPRLLGDERAIGYMVAFAADGRSIALAEPAHNYRLVWCSLVANEQRVLTPGLAECFAPRFAGDGRSVVFVRRDGDLYVAPVGEGSVHRLTTGNRHYQLQLSKHDQHGSTDGPDVAPDGRQIAYVRADGSGERVGTIGTGGANPRPVSQRHQVCARPRWSPDGKRLSFVAAVEGGFQLFVVDADGRGERQITHAGGVVFDTDWAPQATK